MVENKVAEKFKDSKFYQLIMHPDELVCIDPWEYQGSRYRNVQAFCMGSDVRECMEIAKQGKCGRYNKFVRITSQGQDAFK